MPPDPGAAWAAEIGWRTTGDTARFVAAARCAIDGQTAVVGTSGALAWPPAGPEGIAAMTAAAEQLEAELLGAGWEPAAARLRLVRAPLRLGAGRRHGADPADAGAAASAVHARDGVAARGRRALARRDRLGLRLLAAHASRCSPTPPAVRSPAGSGGRTTWPACRRSTPTPPTSATAAPSAASPSRCRTPAGSSAGLGQRWYSARFLWRGEGTPPLELDVGRRRTLARPRGR